MEHPYLADNGDGDIRPTKKMVKCWEHFQCPDKDCPVYKNKDLRCWLVSGTHCREKLQGRFVEKIEMCLNCEPFKNNIDLASMEETLKVVSEQFDEFRSMVEERDRELEDISMELAVGLSEAFEGLKEIAAGNPRIRVPEDSKLQLLAKLKHFVNITAEHLGEIVDLSHEFAMGLAEHFSVLHRVSMGDLMARISGRSSEALLESLKIVTNKMIESVSTEISERKRIERALKVSEAQLRESEEKYRTLFEYDPNSIFVLELGTLKILDVNARAIEVYGYEKEDLIGKSFMELGAEPYPEGVLSDMPPQAGTLCSVYTELQHRRKDGSPFHVNVYACQTNRLSKYGIIATTVDITEALAKETQLIQASKMSTLGVMATGVAHELNQPLTTIQLGADLIISKIKEDKVITESFLDLISQQIIKQVGRAVGIINHLREFGRKTEIRREETNINIPLKEVFSLLSQQLKVRGIRVVLDLEEKLPLIIGDKNRLEQVFIDLVVNARDAMAEKQKRFPKQSLDNTLTARTFLRENRVVASIRDTGTGIPTDIKEKIFEPFFTTKKVGEGTGLGLSISYQIIKDYEGTIEVESQVGEGTSFSVSFPCLAQ